MPKECSAAKNQSAVLKLLASEGFTTAELVAYLLKFTERNSAYKVLKRLEVKGFIKSTKLPIAAFVSMDSPPKARQPRMLSISGKCRCLRYNRLLCRIELPSSDVISPFCIMGWNGLLSKEKARANSEHLMVLSIISMAQKEKQPLRLKWNSP